MKLYAVVGSPNCRKVQAVIGHLGIALEIEYLDFFTGDLRAPDYVAINPNGQVPALLHDDLALWESNVIMQYLADSVPGNELLPADRKQRADVMRWQAWELANFNKALSVLSFETVAKPGFLGMPPDADAVSWATRELKRYAPVLDRALAGRQYLVGEGITLADYSMIYNEGFKGAVPFDWSPFADLNAYFDRMRQAPHWLATAPSGPEAIGRRPI